MKKTIVAKKKKGTKKGTKCAKVEKKAPSAAPSAPEKLFFVHMNLAGQVYEASGDTFQEALLNLKPPKVNTKAVFTFNHAGKTATAWHMAPMTRRIITNAPTAFHFGRRLTLLLK